MVDRFKLYKIGIDRKALEENDDGFRKSTEIKTNNV